MAAHLTEFTVRITDAEGKTVEVDEVSLIAAGVTQKLDIAPFSFLLSGPGSGTLTLVKKGHITYTFDVDIAETGPDFTLTLSKNLIDIPRMLVLTKEAPASPESGAGRNILRIILGEPREFLLIAGLDYFTDHSGGMAFEQLATKRMHDLREAGSLEDSSVVTVFDCKSGLRTQWVMGRGSEEKAPSPNLWKSGWSRIAATGTKPSTLSPSGKDYPGLGVFGMAEMHRYVEEVGKQRPGTLKEYSILSHGWFGGPILYNTEESADFKTGGAKEKERDPKDKDARFHKDYNSVNMPNRSDFVAAFAKDCLVKIWGCFATSAFMNMLNAARNATNDTQKLGIKEELRKSRNVAGLVFDDTRPGTIRNFKESILRFNAMSILAQTIGRPVFGGAPGMGALFKFGSKFGFNLFIAKEDVKTKTGTIKGFKPQMEFIEKEMGGVFDADGYLRYDP